jgi:hypothetical protein
MTDGFHAEQIDGIALHTFTDHAEESVDIWADTLAQWIDSMPPEQPFRVLLDVSVPQVSFTRYARQKSLDIFSRFRHRQGRFAFLFSSRTAPFYARIFLASLGRLEFQIGYFHERDTALSWLRE